MTSLLVAAGGGGDALAAVVISTATGDPAPVVATYAWERLMVDPTPGPRCAADFTGLGGADLRQEVTSRTDTVPPGRSLLPRLAAETAARILLLDPTHGARGIADTLLDLVDSLSPEPFRIIDVGGDAIARGDEPELRSPLADGLALAACSDLEPTGVLVAGPGLDGELSEESVRARIAALGGKLALRLTESDVKPFLPLLSWHPSEATALLIAAARGLRGQVEIREQAAPVTLTEHSAHVYWLPFAEVRAGSLLVPALERSRSLEEAETITRQVVGHSEIDYERQKTARRASKTVRMNADPAEFDQAIYQVEEAACERGTEFVTFRRVAEALNVSATTAGQIRAHLIASRPDRYAPPLWSVGARHSASLPN